VALAIGLLVIGQSLPAAALPPAGYSIVAYYDVATSAAASRAGYGGLGSSGGSGDNTVRIINPTAQFGTLCANIYVFDDFEELQTCCGCPVSPDGQRTLSVLNDLTSNFGVHLADLNHGVIKIVSATPNFFPSIAPGVPFPPGTNGNAFAGCSPSGDEGDTTFHRSTDPTFIFEGIRGWITHDESQQPGSIVGGKVASGVSVDEFQDVPNDFTELDNLEANCAALIANSSGTGVCTCGVGDNAILSPTT
jgi:hypothetical protein